MEALVFFSKAVLIVAIGTCVAYAFVLVVVPATRWLVWQLIARPLAWLVRPMRQRRLVRQIVDDAVRHRTGSYIQVDHDLRGKSLWWIGLGRRTHAISDTLFDNRCELLLNAEAQKLGFSVRVMYPVDED